MAAFLKKIMGAIKGPDSQGQGSMMDAKLDDAKFLKLGTKDRNEHRKDLAAGRGRGVGKKWDERIKMAAFMKKIVDVKKGPDSQGQG